MIKRTVPTEIAVAWAAIFVPFLVFLNPSMPQDRNNLGTPVESVMLIMVLFLVTLTLHTGIIRNGSPLISNSGVAASGNTFALCLQQLGTLWIILILNLLYPLTWLSENRFVWISRQLCHRLSSAPMPASVFCPRLSVIADWYGAHIAIAAWAILPWPGRASMDSQTFSISVPDFVK